jgi:tetraacyldisaccharide 4'-kinase
VFYAPFDYRSVVRRVLRQLRPAAVVVMETEIWPNLYREAKRSGAQLVVINGRISDKALPRYMGWRWFFRHALELPDAIWVQSAQDAERYVLAGAPAERVVQAGNLKYDLKPPKEIAADLREFLDRLGARQVWVAASTMPPDEDDIVIEAWQGLAAEGRLLILAPRKPERFDVVAKMLRAAGVPFVRRTELGELRLPGVLLLDSIGELAAVFARADVVFMGGTIAPCGGHNILEPAYFGKLVIAGPHMENFAEMAAEFTGAGALVRIANAGELRSSVESLLANPGDVGARARELAEAKRGVVDRVVARVLEAVGDGVSQPLRTWPARVVLKPLACAWAAGHRWNLDRGRREMRSLKTRVVSVGGLTMGGSGKSPLVAHLASRLENPAILTRGYRRQQGGAPLVVHRGATASMARTGDEAQMFVRRAVAHVGIGADRHETGGLIEDQLEPDVMLLDDGFQHVRLKRDVDIVVIDATDPWGGGLFPLGRRRSQLKELSRATVIVLTRVARGASSQYATTRGIERVIRRYNAKAPIFQSRMVPEPIEGVRRVAAFCGIGSPRAFWATLGELGLEVVERTAFRDHHAYALEDLLGLVRRAQAAGAEALVTTEKDMMNLPEGVELPLEVRVVRIAMEIENEAELLRIVRGEE